MNEELMHALSESAMQLRLMMATQFIRPMKEMDRNSLPPGYHHVLHCLVMNHGKPVSMTVLSQSAWVSKPNLTNLVNRLCQEGLVERRQDPKDRRVITIALTEKGISFLQRQKLDLMEFMKARLSTLETAELKKAKDAMDQLVEVFTVLKANQNHQGAGKDNDERI